MEKIPENNAREKGMLYKTKITNDTKRRDASTNKVECQEIGMVKTCRKVVEIWNESEAVVGAHNGNKYFAAGRPPSPLRLVGAYQREFITLNRK